MMGFYDLCAINTYFQPKKDKFNAIFIASSSGGQQYVGRKVEGKYKGVAGIQAEVRSKTSHNNSKG